MGKPEGKKKPTLALIDAEVWKTIEGYEGLYEVSNKGGVRSLDRISKFKERWGSYTTRRVKGRIMGTRNKDNYPIVSLYIDGRHKTYLVHRLVAKAFIDNPDNLPEVNHIDETRMNNNVENLEWVDRRGNALHSIHKTTGSKSGVSILNEASVWDIKRLFEEGYSNLTIASWYEVHHSTISKIRTGVNWGHVE